MSRYERFGTRDLTFSSWHRSLPNSCTAIDIDFLEYCQRCRAPLALIELARDVGQDFKATTVMERLAECANVRAYLVLYELDEGEKYGMGRCRVSRVWPDRTPLKRHSLDAVGRLIVRIHEEHQCANRATAA